MTSTCRNSKLCASWLQKILLKKTRQGRSGKKQGWDMPYSRCVRSNHTVIFPHNEHIQNGEQEKFHNTLYSPCHQTALEYKHLRSWEWSVLWPVLAAMDCFLNRILAMTTSSLLLYSKSATSDIASVSSFASVQFAAAVERHESGQFQLH